MGKATGSEETQARGEVDGERSGAADGIPERGGGLRRGAVPPQEEKMTVPQADLIAVHEGPLGHGHAIHRGRAGGPQVLNFEFLPLAPAYEAMARG